MAPVSGCGRPACRSRPPCREGRRQRRQEGGAFLQARAARQRTTAEQMSSSPIPLAAAAPTSLKVMTVNTHKGFTALNR